MQTTTDKNGFTEKVPGKKSHSLKNVHFEKKGKKGHKNKIKNIT